jgi:CheY-like chemotaxis protein
MLPPAPAFPIRKPDAPCHKFTLNGTEIAPVAQPERSENFSREQNPSCPFGREIDEPSLIYVVDDEPRLTDLYTIILETKGYAVRTFTNRVEALAELKGAMKKPDLVIMDYLGHTMPVDGFIRLCLLAHPNLRILVATGYSQIDARFAYRPDRFIQKPFTAEEFLQEVEAALMV